jgi:hypothetical protein
MTDDPFVSTFIEMMGAGGALLVVGAARGELSAIAANDISGASLAAFFTW